MRPYLTAVSRSRDITQLSLRLEKVEGDLAAIQALSTGTHADSGVCEADSGDSISSAMSITDQSFHENTRLCLSSESLKRVGWPRKGPGCRHIVNFTDDSQTYHGPASLVSVIGDVNEFVLGKIRGPGLPLKDINAVSTSLAQLAAFQTSHDRGDRSQDASNALRMPSTPPLPILRAMIDPYFDFINPHFPIWGRASFQRQIDLLSSQHARDPLRAMALGLCSNNIILLTLTARSSQEEENTVSLNWDLASSFLSNAKQAIKSIDLLLQPRLINVQAILSLVRHDSSQPLSSIYCP